MPNLTRREMIFATAGLAAAAPHAWATPATAPAFFFKIRGKAGFLGGGDGLGVMRTDGSGMRALDFEKPNHIGFQPCAFFKDGKRALLMSIETNEDWKTKTFQEYYHKSRTYIWIFDLETNALTEIAQKDRIAPFYAPCALLPNEERMLVTVDHEGKQNILYSMNLDGTDARPITQPNEFVYGVSVSPDGQHIAFHADYQINVMSIDGSKRKALTQRPGLLHFGTSWSPDGAWVLYQVCDPAADPGHDWSDLWIARPDGSEGRALTQGNAAWFASSYGAKDNPGNGSIMPQWAPDGSGILFAQRLPDAKSPWEFQPNRPDTTHFNRDFKPEDARGGTRIACIDPKDGTCAPLTHLDPLQWEWRPEWSPTSQEILFCRAAAGENPAIWVMDRNGKKSKRLTDGLDHNGAEFPRFLGRA